MMNEPIPEEKLTKKEGQLSIVVRKSHCVVTELEILEKQLFDCTNNLGVSTTTGCDRESDSADSTRLNQLSLVMDDICERVVRLQQLASRLSEETR